MSGTNSIVYWWENAFFSGLNPSLWWLDAWSYRILWSTGGMFGMYVQYTHDNHIFHFYLRDTILPKGGYGSELTGPAGFRWFSTENETVYGSFDAFFLTYTHLWVPDISIDIPTWRPSVHFLDVNPGTRILSSQERFPFEWLHVHI